MGTRIVYQVRDGDQQLVATLFSNSSHTTQFAEAVFDAALKQSSHGPTRLIQTLLNVRYETAEGGHTVGERIFFLVPPGEAEEGDRESVIRATYMGAAEELIEKGYIPAPSPAWVVAREDF